MADDFDPCDHVATMDLDDPQVLRSILRRDKHARIEGLCSEALFSEEFLRRSGLKTSTGWWFKKSEGRFRVAKLLKQDEAPSELDLGLLTHLEKHCRTLLVKFDKATRQFRAVRFHQDLSLGDCWETESRPLKKGTPFRTPAIQYRQAHRLDLAIDYLSKGGLLREAALSRVLANCYLGKGSIFDLDFFLEHHGHYFALEVKHEYPFRDGTGFGINTGEASLFSFLNSLHITPVYVILTKPVRKDNVPAVELYTSSRYRALSCWLATNCSGTNATRRTRIAPPKTSIDGRSQLSVFEIALGEFHLLKHVGDGDTNALVQFLDGKTRPLPGTWVYPVAY